MPYNKREFGARRFYVAIVSVAVLVLNLITPSAVAANVDATTQAKTIVVLPFDMIDTSVAAQKNDGPLAGDIARLKRTQQVVRQAVRKQPAFKLLSNDAIKSEIKDAQDTYPYLYECEGCQIDIGKKASAQLVMTGWLQKVSNLIMAINATVFSVKTGKEVAVASVGMRSDTDKSWRHAARYLINVRLMKNYHILQARNQSSASTDTDTKPTKE